MLIIACFIICFLGFCPLYYYGYRFGYKNGFKNGFKKGFELSDYEYKTMLKAKELEDSFRRQEAIRNRKHLRVLK